MHASHGSGIVSFVYFCILVYTCICKWFYILKHSISVNLFLVSSITFLHCSWIFFWCILKIVEMKMGRFLKPYSFIAKDKCSALFFICWWTNISKSWYQIDVQGTHEYETFFGVDMHNIHVHVYFNQILRRNIK